MASPLLFVIHELISIRIVRRQFWTWLSFLTVMFQHRPFCFLLQMRCIWWRISGMVLSIPPSKATGTALLGSWWDVWVSTAQRWLLPGIISSIKIVCTCSYFFQGLLSVYLFVPEQRLFAYLLDYEFHYQDCWLMSSRVDRALVMGGERNWPWRGPWLSGPSPKNEN